MGIDRTSFSISKPNQRDSSDFVSFASVFHLNPQPRCAIYLLAFWTQYLWDHLICILLESFRFALLLVVGLLNFELYCQGYDHLKVAWILESWFENNSVSLHILRTVNHFDLHIGGKLMNKQILMFGNHQYLVCKTSFGGSFAHSNLYNINLLYVTPLISWNPREWMFSI